MEIIWDCDRLQESVRIGSQDLGVARLLFLNGTKIL